jgi:MinD-like ATPase involved in chromosome partitioning or flagellar assembly
MPKIVSVYSFRHGTGKTNLAANLAVSIAQHVQRVGIIDTDGQASGVHTLFGLDEDQSDRILNYYLWSDVDLQEASPPNPLLKVEQGEVAVMGGGTYLTSSRIKVNEMARRLREGYDTSTLSQGLFELSHRLKLDCLIIDTNPGLSEDTLLAIALSDILVLVLCLDQQSFQGIALTLDIARMLGVPKILLVASQVLPDYSLEEVKQQLEATYGYPVAAVLPFSQELLTLASSDIFCLRYPKHLLSGAVRAIAKQITDFSVTKRADALQSLLPTTLASGNTGSGDAASGNTASGNTGSGNTASKGVSMFDLLLLSDLERQLMNWIIRQGKTTLSTCVVHMGQPRSTIEATLERLAARGMLQTTQLADDLYYLPKLTSDKQQLLPNQIWEALGDNKPE